MDASEILKKGIGWRLGNGASIKIWKDRWIPRLPTATVMSPVNGLGTKACVSCLIDLVTKQWKTSLVEDMFSLEQVAMILQIPISSKNSPDKLIW